MLPKKSFTKILNDANPNTTLSTIDYNKKVKGKKIILLNLNPFIGIDALATEPNMSATKLKVNFKTVFGFSMLEDHKEKNILLAMQLIKKSKAEVNIIASMTGFEGVSKFTATFKKHFGKLPFEIRNF